MDDVSTLQLGAYLQKAALKRRWLDFVDGLGAARTPPASCGSFFLVSRAFLAIATIAQAKTTAWSSVGLSIALAFAVLLLFTNNWRIAALATLTIGAVVVAVVG